MTRILFTDLDGTLLDHSTYEPGPAAPAVAALHARGVEIVFVSSKTRTEQEAIAARLDLEPTLIVENGAAVVGESEATTFGVPRSTVRDRLHSAADRLGVRIRGYGDVDPSQVASWTGLTGDALERALERSWSETFVIDDGDPARLQIELVGEGLRLSRGGRFWTAHGPHDKGTAVGAFLDLHSGVESFAVGDAPADEPMFRRVDRSALVRRPDGSWADVSAPGMTRIDAPGPRGFVRAITITGW